MIEGLDQLYQAQRYTWIRLARRRVGQDAEDAVHDAMVRLLEGESASTIEALITRTSKTLQQRERRRGIIHTREAAPWAEALALTPPAYDLRIAIRQALDQVDAELVLRTVVGGEPLRVLAHERGYSTQRAGFCRQKALQRLALLLGEHRNGG